MVLVCSAAAGLAVFLYPRQAGLALIVFIVVLFVTTVRARGCPGERSDRLGHPRETPP
jgi:hypothetical protein